MEKIRLGVIGFGNMGTGHVKSVAEGKVPDMVMGAICDIAPSDVRRPGGCIRTFRYSAMRRNCTAAACATR